MKKIIVLGFVCSQIFAGCTKQEKASPIEGAWKMVEYSFSSPDSIWTNTSPQPGLFIFEKEYYSIMYLSGEEPRPLYPENYTRSLLTDEQIRATFMEFVANSGKYEINESIFSARPIVALEPNFMTDGFSEYEYKIENETMLLTRTVTSGVRGYKLIRLEQ